MSSLDGCVNLQSIRDLAHSLYCQCQRQLNAYRPISKSIKTLRNRLEEADELLDESTCRAEEYEILQAASASKAVLQQLELTLQHHNSTTSKEDAPDESFIIDFLEHIDAVTLRLTNALTALEEQTGTLELFLDTSIQQRVLSPAKSSLMSTVSREYRRSLSTVSDLYPPILDRTNADNAMAAKHRSIHSLDHAAIVQQKHAVVPRSVASLPSRPGSTFAPEVWRTPYFDPLSLDIDQASHMILGQDSEMRSTRVDSGIVHTSLVDRSTRSPAVADIKSAPQLLNDTSSIESRPDFEQPVHGQPLSEVVTAVRALVELPELGTQSTPTDTSHSGMATSSKLPASHSASIDEATFVTDIISSESTENGEIPALQAIRAQTSPSNSLSTRPPQRYLSSRLGKLQRPPRMPESRYRIVNTDHLDTEESARDIENGDDQNIRRIFVLQQQQPRPSSSISPSPSRRDLELAPTTEQTYYGHQRGHPRAWTATDSNLRTGSSTPVSVASPSIRALSVVSHEHTDTVPKSSDRQTAEEQLVHITQKWNEQLWAEAQDLIASYMLQMAKTDFWSARRLRFLLGVLASLKGEWRTALINFILTLNNPITAASQLDAGDCAAAYWLGDIYALLDRRSEALLSYSIAERGALFQDANRQRLHQCIRAEQEACRSREDSRSPKLNNNEADSILNSSIITSGAADSFLSYVRWQPSAQEKSNVPSSSDSRSLALWKLGLESESKSGKNRFHIDTTVFDPSSPWPLSFDPFFAIANVAQGRLLAHECDLLQTFASGSAAKVAKAGSMGRGKSDCFTWPDLIWLIKTIRKCLGWLEAEWNESTNPQSTWFAARYNSTEDKIATVNYFTISIFKLSFRSGYGVDICPGGLSSARILRTEPNFERGVHKEETKRVKTAVRQYLELAARKQEAANTRGTALPVMSINGGYYRDPDTKTGAVRYG